MLRVILRLLFFLFLSSLAQAQDVDDTFNKLVDAGVLKKRDRSEFNQLIQQRADASPGGVLAAITAITHRKAVGSVGWYTMVSFDGYGMNEKDKAKLQAQLTALLGKLKLCGLIDDTTYNVFAEKIRAPGYLHEILLLTELTLHIGYAERIAPPHLHPFADSLRHYNIVSDSHYTQLRHAIDSGQLKSHYQLLDYCEHGVAFDLADYPDDPALYLPAIHERVAQLFPELTFRDFSFRIVVDSLLSDSTYTSTNVIVSLKCNDQVYQHQSFIATTSIEDHDYLGKIDETEFYQVFNKVLADRQSPYRLYMVGPDLVYARTYQYFGVIGLTEEQAESLRRSGGPLDISYEDHRDLLTSEKIRDAIEEYRAMGLLNHLSEDQISESKEKIARSRLYNLNDVLSLFPAVVHNFDTELANLDDPYRELLEAYREISHGALNPTNIVDEFNLDKSKSPLQFTLNAKVYTTTPQVDNDWIDPDFFTFVDQAVEENNLPGRFYFLIGDGQIASVIFLTEKQYRVLKEKELVVFGEM